MNISNDLPRYTLFALIGVIILLLLNRWVDYSAEYDQALLAQQARLSAPAVDYPDINTDNGYSSDNSNENNSSFAGTSESDEAIPSESLPDNSTLTSTAEPLATQAVATHNRIVEIETDTLIVKLDRRGGDIVGVALKKYRQSRDENSPPFNLLEKSSTRTYVAQSGLIGPNGTDSKAGRAVFSSAKDYYQMQDDQALEVDLRFTNPNGVTLIKRYTFQPGEHLFEITYHINNQSNEDWQATFYSQINRDSTEDPGANDAGFGVQAYLGAATTTEDKPYKKISFDDMSESNYRHQRSGGWIAMLQHYFVSAWVPDSEQTHNFYTKRSSSGLNIIGFTGSPIRVAAGDTGTVSAQFYAGPKDQYRLEQIAPHLDLTIDYGWLWMISQPLYALLFFFATGELHLFGKVVNLGSGVGNWGVAIILLTVLIKLVFFQLSAASYRSMANMRRVQPKLLALRERYGDDKQAQSKAMMELYQKEKINPLGGCLPILIQMPVFIALYWALIESVELRHAPFYLWIDDLSVMDPYFVLPIIMGATMWFQQKLNPPPPDPMQAKVMQWMPIIFTFFFLWFPAGLVVYWVSNNLLSIAQQWVITRRIENAK